MSSSNRRSAKSAPSTDAGRRRRALPGDLFLLAHALAGSRPPETVLRRWRAWRAHPGRAREEALLLAARQAYLGQGGDGS